MYKWREPVSTPPQGPATRVQVFYFLSKNRSPLPSLKTMDCPTMGRYRTEEEKLQFIMWRQNECSIIYNKH